MYNEIMFSFPEFMVGLVEKYLLLGHKVVSVYSSDNFVNVYISDGVLFRVISGFLKDKSISVNAFSQSDVDVFRDAGLL